MSYPDAASANFPPALIIDANRAAAEQLAGQLEHAGFAADTVDGCWGALTAVHARHYGSMIFVGDLSQPSHLECIAGLRRQAPRCWMIVISPAGLHDTRKLFLTYGVDALIVTPFSMSDLVSRLMAFSRRATRKFNSSTTQYRNMPSSSCIPTVSRAVGIWGNGTICGIAIPPS